MRPLYKSLYVTFSSILLLLVLISSSVALVNVQSVEQCPINSQLFQTYRIENSHTALVGGQYNNAFCYSPLHNDTAGDGVDTLIYPDPTTIRTCWGGNVVLRATADSNAHVALPNTGIVDENAYPTDLCYGYLQCSNTVKDGATTHNQLVAKLSSTENAHISRPGTSQTADFPVSLYCWEPVCDSGTYNEKTPFPNLYTFDASKEHFELANLEKSDVGTTGFFEVPPNKLYDRALRIAIGGTDKSFTMGNIRIQDWSDYADFEFFLYYESELKLRDVTLSFDGGDTKYNLWNHMTTLPKPNEWNKVRIPVAELGINAVEELVFNLQNSNNRAEFFVDSMTFIPKNENLNNMFDTFYCSLDSVNDAYRWIEDVDSNPVTCDNINGFMDVGGNIGCCGDDPNEMLLGPNAGCFNSTPVPNNSVFDIVFEENAAQQLCIGDDCARDENYVTNVTDDDDTVVASYISGQTMGYSNQEFISCASAYATKNDGGACLVIGDYFCDPNTGQFSNRVDNVVGQDLFEGTDDTFSVVSDAGGPIESAANRTVLKRDDSSAGAFMCCPDNYCSYDGMCYEDMSDEPSHEGILINGVNQRCVGGSWSAGIYKSSPDGSESGYCPNDSDCFFSTRAGQPQCIASNTEYFDNYCYAGSWSSRTSVLARTLAEFAVEEENAPDYTLFCDTYDKTLNFLGSVGEDTVRDLLVERNNCDVNGCVNNFCVLNPTNDELMFGTSLNFDINNKTAGLGAVFNLSCEEEPTNGGYIECDQLDGDAGKWFYYPESDIVIFKKNLNAVAGVLDFISDSFRNILTLLPFINDPTSDLGPKFANVQLFNRAYRSTGGDVEIQGFTEKVYSDDVTIDDTAVDTMFIQYESNYNMTICDVVDSLKASFDLTDDADVTCTNVYDDATRKYTVQVISVSGEPKVKDLWVELTAKIRD